MEFIENNIEHRRKKLPYLNSNETSTQNDVQRQVVCLPFKSNYYRMSWILKEYNISTIPIVDKNLKSIVKLGKDTTKKWEQTNVVYQFYCKDCPATYVGETKRSLKIRINEHKKHKTENSVVSLHEINNNHTFDWVRAKILHFETNFRKRLLSEMIFIKINTNSINKKEDIDGLSSSYFPLLRTFKSK